MEWISVKDRLPYDEEECLIVFKSYKSNIVVLAYFSEIEDGWNCVSVPFNSEFVNKREVSHWIKIPTPPSKSERM